MQIGWPGTLQRYARNRLAQWGTVAIALLSALIKRTGARFDAGQSANDVDDIGFHLLESKYK